MAGGDAFSAPQRVSQANLKLVETMKQIYAIEQELPADAPAKRDLRQAIERLLEVNAEINDALGSIARHFPRVS